MSKQFENKVAVTTGSASGMGKQTAIEFAKQGAKVVIADWADGTDTVNAIKALGGEALYVKCDVSKEADVKNVIDTAVATFGSVDFGFNNAGVELGGFPLEQTSVEEFDKVVGINLRGVFLCIKYEAIQMLKQGKGVIVNTASAAGLVGVPSLSAYTASKHGIVGLTKTAALDFGKRGIRINTVCPGAIRTPMLEDTMKNSAAAKEQIEASQILGRIGEPQEIADAVIWLCSDASSFVNGVSLPVDGGWVAQ
ncbi:MAG: glucose 1-dehydrogenase [Arachidicoccus sp.]|nr:glucose 1-dehydrogenase [Arachidicoccus sp.]